MAASKIKTTDNKEVAIVKKNNKSNKISEVPEKKY